VRPISGLLDLCALADGFEGSLNEVFPLFADAVIDRGHRLDGAGGRTGEGELAVGDLALIQGKRAVAEDDKLAVGEVAAVVFVEIEDDFFVIEIGFGDFHQDWMGIWIIACAWRS